MRMPPFNEDEADLGLGDGTIGDAFQVFTGEVLHAEYPGLQVFPAPGRDGGIDFCIDHCDGTRTVGDCKHVGAQGADAHDAARARWCATWDTLGRHLAGPQPGQSQYAPWYDAERPITRYLFCVSCRLGNVAQKDDLRRQISGRFAEKASVNDALAHLADMAVEVIDHADLAARITPHLLFKWFPRTRPNGFTPIGGLVQREGFRAYFDSATLPYYSREQHLSEHPAAEGSNIVGETELLERLGAPDALGLVITGSGGAGKTRLTLELGLRALAEGWTVLVAREAERVGPEAIQSIAASADPTTPVLIVFDYVETQQSFENLVYAMRDVNETAGLRMRYVASCRTSYYGRIAGIGGQERYETTGGAGAVKAWLEDYQSAVVRHILCDAGIGAEEHIRLCREVPVLAVFLAFLHDEGRGEDLRELLDVGSFEGWVIRRVRSTFPEMREIERRLAELIVQFPMADQVLGELTEDEQDLLDKLAADEWVMQPPQRGTWEAAHDVLVDRIVLSYLETIPATRSLFVTEALEEGGRLGTLRSGITALQRVEDGLADVDWADVLGARLAADGAAWREVRDLLARTSLVPTGALMTLLRDHPEVWEDAWNDVNVQNGIGWHARAVVMGEAEVAPDERAVLEDWIERCVAAGPAFNMVVACGLQLAPERIRDEGLGWLRRHTSERQATFVICAWLETEGPVEAVREHVVAWLAVRENEVAVEASYVLPAWLDASGDHEAVRDHVLAWLAVRENEVAVEASYVLPAWLDAGGDYEAVRDHVVAWLAVHETAPEAEFVYKSCLDASGDHGAVREHVLAWLAVHETAPEAQFVYKSWLDASGDYEAVRGHVLAWLAVRENEVAVEASYVLPAWLDASRQYGAVRGHVLAWLAVDENETAVGASHVYKSWLDAGGDYEAVRDHVLAWLAVRENEVAVEASYVLPAGLDASRDYGAVRGHVLAWLAVHETAPEAQFVYNSWLDASGDHGAVREHVLAWLAVHETAVEASHVYKSWLDAGGDYEAVRGHVLAWLAVHETAPEAQFVYKSWLDASADHEAVRDHVLAWLAVRENEVAVKASYALPAWLDASRDYGAVRDHVLAWLAVEENETAVGASHVYKSSLDAGADYEAVRDHVLAWLAVRENEVAVEASYVLPAWLDASRDCGAVRDHVLAWLAVRENEVAVEASYVLPAWLDASRDYGAVRDHVLAWLAVHETTVEASHVYKRWLDASGDHEAVRDHVLTWLAVHETAPEASFVYPPWLKAGGAPDLVRSHLERWVQRHGTDRGASWPLAAWLDAVGVSDWSRRWAEGWYRQWHDDRSAAWVLRAWGRAGGDPADLTKA